MHSINSPVKWNIFPFTLSEHMNHQIQDSIYPKQVHMAIINNDVEKIWTQDNFSTVTYMIKDVRQA